MIRLRKAAVIGLLTPILMVGGALDATVAHADVVGHTKVFPGTINLSFATPNGTEFLVAELTKDAGIFTKYGLNVNVESISAAVIGPAFLSGSVQVSTADPPALELLYQSGVPIKLIATSGNHVKGQFIARPGITSLKDLEGKPIGALSPTALSTILPEYALKTAGVPISSVTFVPTGANPTGSFVAGEFDAIDASSGEALQAEAELPGTTVLYNFTKVAWPLDNVWASTSWLTGNKAEAVALLRALNAGEVKWTNDPSLADQEIAKYQNLTSQTSIAGAYVATKAEYNHGNQPLRLPTTKLESFVNKVLRLVGFSKAYNSYAEKGQEWTPVYWCAAFGCSS